MRHLSSGSMRADVWPGVNSGLVFRGMKAWQVFTLVAVAGSSCAALAAQSADRITQDVNPAQVVTLPHHHPLWANAANDAGPLPAAQPLEHLTLVLSRSPQQEAAFTAFLAAQQDPASPDYHHWLTPAEVGRRFGLTDADIASFTAWLQSQGLHVNWVSPSRIFIGFGGTAADVGRAFQTEMHTYRVNGAERISVSSEPAIPQALAPAVKAVHGLYTINDRPAHHVSTVQSASPQMTITSGGQTYHFISPADFATIYDVPVTYNGYGQTIGIVAEARTDFADFANFRNLTSSGFQDPTEVVPTVFGGVDPGPALTAPPSGSVSFDAQSEATLDVTRAGTVADNASLLLVVNSGDSGGIAVDAQYLVQTTPVPAQIMTISFGACEAEAGVAGVTLWDTLFQQAAAEGISIFVSSGDSGASGCDQAFATPPASPNANSPNYICSSSYATCVGGTEFNDTANPSNYWSPTSGIDTALRYIPEGGWNEPLNSSSSPQVASSGGGVSSVIPTPAWQTGTGVPAARSGRYTPDISFSSSCHDAYFACMAAGGGSCVVTNGSYYFLTFCGTSAAAPSMAGIAALLDAKVASVTGATGAALGNLNPGIYQLASSASSAFHDATPATSGVTTCSVSTPSMCNNSIPGPTGISGGQAGYPVTVGFDEVTGLGSLDVNAFLNAYYALRSAPDLTVTLSSFGITTLQPLTATVTVSGPSGSPTPTGSVVLSTGSYNSAATPLVAGVATVPIPAETLPNGQNSMAATYTPDSSSASTYYAATGWATVIVNLAVPSITQTLSSTNITTAQELTDTVVVSGGSGNPTPAGTVNLDGGGYGGSVTLNNGSATFNISAGLLTAGTNSLQAYFAASTQGYAVYSSETVSTTVTVTPTAQFTPVVTVTPSANTTIKANPLQVAIGLSAGSGNPTPTGSVVLTTGGYSSPSTTLIGGLASITIPAETLSTGADVLTAIYSPDAASLSTYNNTSGSAQVTVYDPVISNPDITFFSSATTITTAQSLLMKVTVSSDGGYPITTGTVILSGGGYTSAATPLVANSAQFTVPAGALALGFVTLTASYTPDAASAAIFNADSGFFYITVTLPSFTIAGTSVTISPGATTGNTSTITVTPSGGFTGSVALTAAVTSGPASPQFPPTLSFGTTTPVSISGANAVTAMLTISTTPSSAAPCVAALPQRPAIPWYRTGGVVLACLVFFVLPVRRRKGRTLLGMMLLLAALVSGVVSCGGGGGTACPNISTTGTTSGTYYVTLTGASGTDSVQNTITLIVQ